MKTMVFSIEIGGLPLRWTIIRDHRVPVHLCEDGKSVRLLNGDLDSLLLCHVLEAVIKARKDGAFFGTNERDEHVHKTEMEIVEGEGRWEFTSWCDIIFSEPKHHWTKHIEEQLLLTKQALLKRLLHA
ncbi:hypothetical protein IT407_01595 [Candidatus Uhrbacteria bacterium]|nr:hypothetical protein [Candidatus Uhrbacteria bacterium]